MAVVNGGSTRNALRRFHAAYQNSDRERMRNGRGTQRAEVTGFWGFAHWELKQRFRECPSEKVRIGVGVKAKEGERDQEAHSVGGERGQDNASGKEEGWVLE
jgi:hypothetical protein